MMIKIIATVVVVIHECNPCFRLGNELGKKTILDRFGVL